MWRHVRDVPTVFALFYVLLPATLPLYAYNSRMYMIRP